MSPLDRSTHQNKYISPLCLHHLTISYIAVFSALLKAPKKGGAKKVTEAGSSKIVNNEPIDSVSAISRPEINKNSQIQRRKSLEYTYAEQAKFNSTEEVNFKESYKDC